MPPGHVDRRAASTGPGTTQCATSTACYRRRGNSSSIRRCPTAMPMPTSNATTGRNRCGTNRLAGPGGEARRTSSSAARADHAVPAAVGLSGRGSRLQQGGHADPQRRRPAVGADQVLQVDEHHTVGGQHDGIRSCSSGGRCSRPRRRVLVPMQRITAVSRDGQVAELLRKEPSRPSQQRLSS